MTAITHGPGADREPDTLEGRVYHAADAAPLLRALDDEWVQMCQSTVIRARIQSWADTEPALAGIHGPEEIIAAIKQGAARRKDTILRALIELFQGGHSVAGRIVLQAMLPKIQKMANRDEERLCEAVTAMWEVLSRYPVGRRAHKVAAGLALDTLHLLPRLSAPTATPMDPELIDLIAGAGQAPGGEQPGDKIEPILAWAVRRNVISAEDADLLDGVYGRGGEQVGHQQMAEQLALTEAAVRQRCSRAVRRISAAARAAS